MYDCKRAVKKVPTVILSSEAKDYTGLTELWKEIGDVAKDGNFIFRNIELLKGITYKELDTKKIVTAKEPNALK